MDFPNPPGYYQVKDTAFWPFKSATFSVRDNNPASEMTEFPQKAETHTFAGVVYQWDQTARGLLQVSTPAPVPPVTPAPVPSQSVPVPDELTINGFKYRKVL